MPTIFNKKQKCRKRNVTCGALYNESRRYSAGFELKINNKTLITN